jgi:protein ImuB
MAEERRIAALVLPELPNELCLPAPTRKEKRTSLPLGVVFDVQEPISGTAVLDSVNAEAHRHGVRVGQTITEACALLAHLVVRHLSREQLGEALARVAEVALGFGPTVAFQAPDTVWVDVTGSAHLVGGEVELGRELASRVRALGHVVRVAIANGPLTARALARHRAVSEPLVVPTRETRDAMSELPVTALPIDRERAGWLTRLGVLTLGELAKLPREAAASRLAENASLALDLAIGKDETPLVPYRPPVLCSERTSWDEAVEGSEPLLFVLSGLAARLSLRLAGRGEAAQKLVLVIEHDRTIARHRGVAKERELVFDLASPLWREEELRRVVASRLEKTRLSAPSVGLRLEAPALIRQLARQLDLSCVATGLAGIQETESLPVLLAELGADIGPERMGVLSLVDSHRPERKSEIVPALGAPEERTATRKKQRKTRREPLPLRKVRSIPKSVESLPTRLLPEPLPLEVALRIGATLAIDHRLYDIERMSFVERLESVEWWTGSPVTRDYLRVWLTGSDGGIEALVYVDRETGRRYLHAVVD